MGILAAEIPTRRVLVAALFAVGIFFRVYALDRIPLPIYQDALSNVYDAYSIVETGADRWGSPRPIIVRAFGENDYRPAMMVWLTTLPVKVLGFSTLAARAASAILGCLSLFLIFALARRMAGPAFATIALAFAALSPWLISDARVGHEGASLAPLFFILILYLWHRAAEKEYALSWTLVVGFVTGFSSNAYQTTRLIGPLLLGMMLVEVLRTRRKVDRVTVALVGSALIGAAPQIAVFVTGRDRFFARAKRIKSPRTFARVV